jgi:uncharacterized protein (TIGR00251 family)
VTTPFFRWDGPDLILNIRVQPRARADAFAGATDGWLKVQISAPPAGGRANAALIGFLAGHFGLPKTRIVLERGAGGRRKRLRLKSPRRLPPRLGLQGAAKA